jgi:hypothetical protein
VVPENDLNSPATEGSSDDENPIEGLGTGKGTLKIYLTDAPGKYLEVNVMISKIEGHIAVEDDEGYWEKLKDWPGGLLVDLIKLQDVSILLASLELEVNKYTQLRLFLMGGEEDAWIVIEGEEEGTTSTEPLEIPSVYQTGIKLNRPFEIVEDMITKLTIDFDAKKSVIETGNGKFKMKPVISVSSETYSTEDFPEDVGLGTVSGSVSYYQSGELALVGIGGANIELTGGAYIFGNTTTTSEESGLEGTFSLGNVPAGTYNLNVVAEGYDAYSESGVVVTDEGNTVVDVVFLAEEPGRISGSVVILGTTSAIEGATVSVELDSGIYSFNSSAVTDVNGEFTIEKLPVGSYALTVSAEGYVEYNDVTPGGIGVTAGGINDIGEIGLTLL